MNLPLKSGNVTIILSGTNTLKGWAGIQVDKGATLTIQGGGTLEATGSCTGIGGEGNIIINSGTINATGSDGAGIGGTNQTNPGNVTISGGAVTATSAGGAGIGAGAQPYGKVTITGGVVTATSTNGAGIGDSQSKNCSGVEIGKFATVHSTGLLGKNGISANGGEPDIAEGATINEVSYLPRYTITIPSNINSASAEVSLSGVNIETDKKISVKLSSTSFDSDSGKFYLTDNDSENKIGYTIGLSSISLGNETTVNNNVEILSGTNRNPNDTAKVKAYLYFHFDPITYAGSYTDTLTFTVSMEDATS